MPFTFARVIFFSPGSTIFALSSLLVASIKHVSHVFVFGAKGLWIERCVRNVRNWAGKDSRSKNSSHRPKCV